MKTFINMLKDQSGASAAEYALILAIVGGAIALAAVTLGKTIGNRDELGLELHQQGFVLPLRLTARNCCRFDARASGKGRGS